MMPGIDTSLEADAITAIAHKVKEGRCILFLGAGVHCAPPEGSPYSYSMDERPPMGSRLSEVLATGSGFEQDLPKESIRNLQRVALHYQKRFSRNRLVERLCEE